MRPMLATKGDHVPTGAGWMHEVKWDGMRVLVRRRRRRPLRFWSRNENDVTVSFPELHALATSVATSSSTARWSRCSTACRRSARCRPDARAATVARAGSLAEPNPVTLMVFDLLRLDGGT